MARRAYASTKGKRTVSLAVAAKSVYNLIMGQIRKYNETGTISDHDMPAVEDFVDSGREELTDRLNDDTPSDPILQTVQRHLVLTQGEYTAVDAVLKNNPQYPGWDDAKDDYRRIYQPAE